MVTSRSHSCDNFQWGKTSFTVSFVASSVEQERLERSRILQGSSAKTQFSWEVNLTDYLHRHSQH